MSSLTFSMYLLKSMHAFGMQRCKFRFLRMRQVTARDIDDISAASSKVNLKALSEPLSYRLGHASMERLMHTWLRA